MKKLNERRKSIGLTLPVTPVDIEVRTRKLSAVLPSPSRIRRSSVAHFVFGPQTPEEGFYPREGASRNAEDYVSVASNESATFSTSNACPLPRVPGGSLQRNRAGFASSFGVAASSTSSPSQPPCMGRAMRVVVAGAKRVGKTAILEQIACLNDITRLPYQPTLDDTYQVLLEDGDRPREILVFHDTEGLRDFDSELKKAYLQVADAFVLVYSVNDNESFNRMDVLKKFIDKHLGKEKKEVPIVVLGNQTDLPGRKVDSEFALTWANREKVKLFEVTATDRNTLIDFVHYLGQRHFHPSKDSKFSLTKKLKSEKSNAAILMDF